MPDEETVYYWWWRFMHHHEGYRQCCQRGGSGPYAKLYKAFGNIHALVFRDWWLERGVDCFAEPQPMYKTQLVAPDDVSVLKRMKEQPLLILVPTDAPQSLILKRVQQILKEHHPGTPGRRAYPKSEAAYKIHQHFVIVSLWKMLTAYELRKIYPQVPLWDIGRRVDLAANDWVKGKKIDWKERMAIEISRPHTAEMASLTSATSRMIKKAQKAIENTGKGKFPKFD